MIAIALPPATEMFDAFLSGNASYDGVFITAVRTTGIFCRPSCSARKPLPENVEFFSSSRDALLAGYRPCKPCRPIQPAGQVPEWLQGLLADVEVDPTRRWTDADLRERGVAPERVRRWFQANHGMTFHAYERARRLGAALGRIRHGETVIDSAMSHGYESLSGFNEAFVQLFGTPPTVTRDTEVVTITRILSPLGPMLAGATRTGVCLLEFADRRMLETQLERLRKRLRAAFVPGTSALLDELAAQLAAYFAGDLTRFDVSLDLPGTDFQRLVWDRLRAIPCGGTMSYVALARAIGRPSASRAVARANGDNRVAIIVPCHRVIGADGQLTGYGGGVWRKQKLLEHEGLRFAGDPPRVTPANQVDICFPS